jgi:hypothetical protein
MVFLLIKFFAEIAYQWITVTHLIFATRSFSSFVVPNLGMGVNKKPIVAIDKREPDIMASILFSVIDPLLYFEFYYANSVVTEIILYPDNTTVPTF